jgi:hypothetical protein
MCTIDEKDRCVYCLFYAGFLLGLHVDSEDGSDITQRRRLIFTRPHGDISQNTEIFTVKVKLSLFLTN